MLDNWIRFRDLDVVWNMNFLNVWDMNVLHMRDWDGDFLYDRQSLLLMVVMVMVLGLFVMVRRLLMVVRRLLVVDDFLMSEVMTAMAVALGASEVVAAEVMAAEVVVVQASLVLLFALFDGLFLFVLSLFLRGNAYKHQQGYA